MPTSDHRLHSVPKGLLRPFNQTEAKSVLVDLKDIGKSQPAIAALLEGETPLRDFVVSALTLSPYLREIANLDPGLLASAVEEALEPQIEQLVCTARGAWAPLPGEGQLSESEVMSRLRIVKRKASFLIALADLARVFDGRATPLPKQRFPLPSITSCFPLTRQGKLP
jgi:glutamate-ammonia-ligase adenylyltransferase